MTRYIFLLVLLTVSYAVIGQNQVLDIYALSSQEGYIYLKGNESKVKNSVVVTFHLNPNASYTLKLSGSDNVEFEVLGNTLVGNINSVDITTDDKPMELRMWITTTDKKKGKYSYALLYKL